MRLFYLRFLIYPYPVWVYGFSLCEAVIGQGGESFYAIPLKKF